MVPRKRSRQLLELFLNFSRLGPSEEVPSGGERPKLCFCEHRQGKIMRRGGLGITHNSREPSLTWALSLAALTPRGV